MSIIARRAKGAGNPVFSMFHQRNRGGKSFKAYIIFARTGGR